MFYSDNITFSTDIPGLHSIHNTVINNHLELKGLCVKYIRLEIFSRRPSARFFAMRWLLVLVLC